MTGCVVALVAEEANSSVLRNFLDFPDGVLRSLTGNHFRENASELIPVTAACSFPPGFGVTELSQM